MARVFIIHGAYGNPEENWFPWLREQLEGIGCEVIVPRFPTPKGQSLEGWLSEFERFRSKVDAGTMFVGHSIGAAFILNVLERIEVKVRAVFFVAGFIAHVVDPTGEINAINGTFYEKGFDFDIIKRNCGEFYVLNSDNDRYVTLENARRLCTPLGATLMLIEGAGHFNRQSGYTKFPQLLDMIEDVLTTNPSD